MRIIKPLFILLSGITILSGCKKDKEETPPVKATDVYMAGTATDFTLNTENAVYWKNGKRVTLDSLSLFSAATDIFVTDNNDVYVAGSINPSSGSKIPVYWKNKTVTPLAPVTDYGEANAIAVSGNDVYVAGTLNARAVYWKNGAKVTLGTAVSQARDIKINGTDVYVCGYEQNASGIFVAKYWKNGVPVDLSDGTERSLTFSLFIKNNDVFVGGYEYVAGAYTARCWKNGTALTLNTPSTSSFVYGIALAGTDLYAAGYTQEVSNRFPAYWKNGEPVNLTNGTIKGECNDVFASGIDIYVAGVIQRANNYQTVYWKNGIKVFEDTSVIATRPFSIFIK